MISSSTYWNESLLLGRWKTLVDMMVVGRCGIHIWCCSELNLLMHSLGFEGRIQEYFHDFGYNTCIDWGTEEVIKHPFTTCPHSNSQRLWMCCFIGRGYYDLQAERIIIWIILDCVNRPCGITKVLKTKSLVGESLSEWWVKVRLNYHCLLWRWKEAISYSGIVVSRSRNGQQKKSNFPQKLPVVMLSW